MNLYDGQKLVWSVVFELCEVLVEMHVDLLVMNYVNNGQKL